MSIDTIKSIILEKLRITRQFKLKPKPKAKQWGVRGSGVPVKTITGKTLKKAGYRL